MKPRDIAKRLQANPEDRQALAELNNPPGPARGRFADRDIALVLQMAAAGKTPEQISLGLGVALSRIKKMLHRFTDTSVTALATLRAGAAQAAEQWIKAEKAGAKLGNHKPARDHLAAIGVIHETPTIGQQIVIVGMGGAAIGEDPWALPVVEGTVIPQVKAADRGADDLLESFAHDPEPGP